MSRHAVNEVGLTRTPKPSMKPGVEALEERIVLSTTAQANAVLSPRAAAQRVLGLLVNSVRDFASFQPRLVALATQVGKLPLPLNSPPTARKAVVVQADRLINAFLARQTLRLRAFRIALRGTTRTTFVQQSAAFFGAFNGLLNSRARLLKLHFRKVASSIVRSPSFANDDLLTVNSSLRASANAAVAPPSQDDADFALFRAAQVLQSAATMARSIAGKVKDPHSAKLARSLLTMLATLGLVAGIRGSIYKQYASETFKEFLSSAVSAYESALLKMLSQIDSHEVSMAEYTVHNKPIVA